MELDTRTQAVFSVIAFQRNDALDKFANLAGDMADLQAKHSELQKENDALKAEMTKLKESAA